MHENTRRMQHAHIEVQQALIKVLSEVLYPINRETQRLAVLARADAHIGRGDTDWVTCRLNVSATALSLPGRELAAMLPDLPTPIMASAEWLVQHAEDRDVALLPELKTLLVEIILRHQLDATWKAQGRPGVLLRYAGDIAVLCTDSSAAIRARNGLMQLLAAMDVQPVVRPAIGDVNVEQVNWLGLRLWADDGQIAARIDETMWQELTVELSRAESDKDAAPMLAALFSRVSPARGHAQHSIHRRLNRILMELEFSPVSWTTFHHMAMLASVSWGQLLRRVRSVISGEGDIQ